MWGAPLPAFVVLLSVPNLAMGRDHGALGRVTAAVRAAEHADARCLDVHTDWDHHRTVYTLAGTRSGVEGLVDALAHAALRWCSVQGHTGVHPRLGLLDVVPFVPWGPTPMETALDAARATATRFARELGIPVFRYGQGVAGERARLATFRRVHDRLEDVLRAQLPPDAGPPRPHPRAGVACIGARPPMVAYNVLVEGDEASARALAARLRASNGGPPGVESLVFRLPRRRALQLSFNLRAPSEAGPGVVHRAALDAATPLGLRLGAAEVVGLPPRRTLPADPREAGLRPGLRTLEDALARAGFGDGPARRHGDGSDSPV